MKVARFVPRSLAALLAVASAVVATAALAGPSRAAPTPEKAKPTIAILYMDYTGKDESLAVLKKGIAQMLISDLSSVSTVQIVERDRLQDIMDELQLGTTAKIDPATANKLGKLLGAKYMVLGGFFDLLGTLRVDARLVEVETGKVIRSVGAQGKQDSFLDIEQKLVGDLTSVLTSNDIDAPPPAADPVRPPAHPHPKGLKTKTAVRYGKALDFMDKGKKEEAKQELQAVVAEQPDFALASADLQQLMQ
ncbi:MAG: CsgG/HfaB family protein [Myxococcota bacterium]